MSDEQGTEDQARRAERLEPQHHRGFRANGGTVGGPFEGATLGPPPHDRRQDRGGAGEPARQPHRRGELYVFASKAGADTDPDWYRNLVAHPDVTVELGTETFRATAVEVTGADRDRIFGIQKERAPGFAEYEDKTTRVIPVIELQRA